MGKWILLALVMASSAHAEDLYGTAGPPARFGLYTSPSGPSPLGYGPAAAPAVWLPPPMVILQAPVVREPGHARIHHHQRHRLIKECMPVKGFNR